MSTELVEPVNTIKTLTSTLKANLPHVLYAKVMKQLAKNLDCYLFKRIVQRGTFTLVGVGKFVTDVSILSSRIGKLPRLKDAITLLSLPSESDDDVTKMRRITIRQIFNTIEEGDMEGLQVILNELDVTFLGIEEISYVVDRRID
ncbi:hypothetical protein HK098_001390 [Nowakowskiella sp. JEL0407]|nr:hypothetical protein HK098_001390 [Nowakowskiella sp. JEL0407]